MRGHGEPHTQLDSKPFQLERSTKKGGRSEQVIRQYEEIFNALPNLTPPQRQYLKLRWLDQMLWLSKRSRESQNRYYFLRIITIVGSAIVPALVSLGSLLPLAQSNIVVMKDNAATSPVPASPVPLPADPSVVPPVVEVPVSVVPPTETTSVDVVPKRGVLLFLITWSPYAAFILSQIVAVTAAIDQFFKYGDRWRHYRRSAELLKSSGWQFFQLSGMYSSYAQGERYKEAFPMFVNQVEEIIQSDVEGYISQVATQKPGDRNKYAKLRDDRRDDEER